ncbi:MAG TPA: ABC transporter permease [Fimbriimonas sp.]
MIVHNVSAAIASLREQWQRAALSALGIFVASVAIILLVSIATGVRADVTGQVNEIGVNVLIVIPGRISEGTFSPNMVGASYLKEQDAKALSRVEGVVRTAPFSFVGGGLAYAGKSASSILVATTPEWFRMHPVDLLEGRTFAAEDDDVAVIGSIAKEELFAASSAVGKRIEVNGRKYEVIGVTKDKKGEQSLFSMGGFQNLVYLPYRRVKTVTPDLQTDRIMVQVSPHVEPKSLIARLEAVLSKRLNRYQFQVITQEDLLGLVYKLMGILTWLLTGLTSIALFVGGVGIMTVMLMSVNERSKEVGIRKTVGAKNRDIFQQFLFEAIVLALVGGTFGLAVSYAVCVLLYRFTPIKPLVTPQIVGLSFGVCILVGVVFGLLPALHAARQDPIEALRHD